MLLYQCTCSLDVLCPKLKAVKCSGEEIHVLDKLYLDGTAMASRLMSQQHILNKDLKITLT